MALAALGAIALSGCEGLTEAEMNNLSAQLGGFVANSITGNWKVTGQCSSPAIFFLELTSANGALTGNYLFPDDRVHVMRLTGTFDASSAAVKTHGGPDQTRLLPEVSLAGTLTDLNHFGGTLSIVSSGPTPLTCNTFAAERYTQDLSGARRDDQ